MSKLNIQRFETRPVRAFAVQWDGTKKQAKKIIDMLAEYKIEATWVEQYGGQRKADVVVPETDIALRVQGVNGSSLTSLYLSKDWWLIRQNKDDFIILNPEQFEKDYRIPLNEQENV